MTTFFFILEKWTRVFPSFLLLFLEQKWGNGENAPIFSDKISISSDVCKIPREEKKSSKGRNLKNFRQNHRNEPSLFLNDPSFLRKQAQVSKKRPITEQKPPKFAIFKTAENRVFPNNFFFVRISALNGGVGNVNKSQKPRFFPKSVIRFWTEFISLLTPQSKSFSQFTHQKWETTEFTSKIMCIFASKAMRKW